MWGGHKRKVGGGTSKNFPPALCAGIVHPHLQIASDATDDVCDWWLVGTSVDLFIAFCVSRRRRKMYCGHARLCVCVSGAVRPHYCTDPDVTWGVVEAAFKRGSGARTPLVVYLYA